MMHFITIPNPSGGAIGTWRHRDSWHETLMRLDQYVSIARTAERGKFDCIFFADGNGVRQLDNRALFEAMTAADRPAGFEPVTLLAAIAQHTSQIGLVTTATTTYEEPYTLARKFASLDHLSAGRAGWNIVTTSTPSDSKNFGFDEHLPRDQRYPRALEFVEVCKGLWDSWAEDAFVQDIDSGRYVDRDRVHVLGHKGKYLSVEGPLNVARPPQGYPVLFTAGQSEEGRDLAARHADCVFAIAPTKAAGIALMEDLKARLGTYGRRPEHFKVIPGAGVFVGRTAEEAEDQYAEVGALTPPDVGVQYLGKVLGMDLTGYPLDGPLPDLPPGGLLGVNSVRVAVHAEAKAKGDTIRRAYERLVPAQGHHVFKGTGRQVAEELADWYLSGACDGFMVSTAIAPKGLEQFVDLVIPELQRMKLFRTEYEGHTLRERMGLPRPQSQFFPPAQP